MKKPKQPLPETDMLADYSEILSTGNRKPNRFAGRMTNAPRYVVQPDGTRHEVRTIELDENVAQFFPTSESINAVLRAIVQALPANTSIPQSLVQ